MRYDITHIECEPPIQRKLPKKDIWELVEDWECKIHTKHNGILIYTIKAGYWWDLASVPRPLRGMVDNGSHEYAILVSTLIHDVNYDTHLLKQKDADKLLYEMLKWYKTSCWKPAMYYIAVYAFGKFAYNAFDPKQMEIDLTLCHLNWNKIKQ